MAWCQKCGRQGISKNDVEFCEETQKVLCHPCYSLFHPAWNPAEVVQELPLAPPQLTYEIQLTSANGLSAKLGMGNAVIGFHMPMPELQRVFGPKLRIA